MEFNHSPADLELAARTRKFVRATVMPYESDPRWTDHGPTEELRSELVAAAREAGLLSPHGSREHGGHGLSHLAKALVLEEAGHSLLGPLALNVAAPDEGNAHLLANVASPEQQDQWLVPLLQGQLRTCFAMTEPAPGAGSDPSMLRTVARRAGGDYVINGTKWLITGVQGAAVCIVMAGDLDAGGATMFLVPTDTPGFHVGPRIDLNDSSFVNGHNIVELHDVRVPASTVLGEPGKGLRYAQVRLAPARLTHCMRWLGAAQRAHEVAAAYASERSAFGVQIGSHEGVGFMLADNAIALHTARLSIWHTAWLLDSGHRAGTESSMTKVYCSEALEKVVDRSLQTLGGLGLTRNTPVERIYRGIRAFRIYDGTSEVHRWSIARRLVGGTAS